MILTVLISTGFHAHLARAAAKKPHLDARVFSAKALIDPAIRKEALERLAISDSVLIEAGEEPFWAELNEAAALLEGRAPVIRLSWGAPGESGPGAAAAALISQGGEKNALLLWELL
ncbi:MAG: hypothetical protein LBE49_04045, partial [Deltaproteobacteria bacterium]|nr:hypothetical protein [Deltaproteobacteria bacterium]